MASFEQDRSGLDGVWLALSIAVGVAVGTVVGGVVLWKIAEHQMTVQASEAARSLRKSLSDIEQASRRDAAAAATAREERIQQTAAAQRAEAAARTAAMAEAERRERAWRSFYKPSPGCEGAAVSVECSNEYIRAKRAFDAKVDRGEF